MFVPTLLTIFTITASLEIAGRLRGGHGIFGWIAKLPPLMDDVLPSRHHRKKLQNNAFCPTSVHTPIGGIFGN